MTLNREIARPPRAKTSAWHHGRLEDVSSDASSLAHSLSFESSSLLRIFSSRNVVELIHVSICETGLLLDMYHNVGMYWPLLQLQ